MRTTPLFLIVISFAEGQRPLVPDLPNPRIIIVGAMGSGKSSVARDLSGALGYPVLDTDSLIVERAGKPIRKIFEDNGEEDFRDLETTILTELEQAGPRVTPLP